MELVTFRSKPRGWIMEMDPDSFKVEDLLNHAECKAALAAKEVEADAYREVLMIYAQLKGAVLPGWRAEDLIALHEPAEKVLARFSRPSECGAV